MTDLQNKKKNTATDITRIENIMRKEIQEFQKGFEKERCQLLIDTMQLKYKKSIQNYEELDWKLKSMKHNLNKVRIQFNESRNNDKELKNPLEDKKAYELAVKNYQDTIDRLSKGLAQSESDMKQLKREVLDNVSKTSEYESKNIKLVKDLEKAQALTNELKMQYMSKINSNLAEIQELKTNFAQKVDVYKAEVDSLNGELQEQKDLTKETLQQLQEAYAALESIAVELKNLETINSNTSLEESQINKLEDYRIHCLDWNCAKEKLEKTVKETKNRLHVKQVEVNDLKEQMAKLQEKSDFHLQRLQNYKSKLMKCKQEFDELMNVHVKCTEQSEKYDELLQKYEEIEKENSENKLKCLKLRNDLEEQKPLKKEYDKEKKAYETLLRKYEQLDSENCLNKKKVEEQQSLNKRLDHSEIEMRDMLVDRVDYLENELKEVSKKYADLVGHQNTKQKIKHFADLKEKNRQLIQINIDLELKVRIHLRSLEKLKKENAELKERVRENELYTCEKENVV